MPKISEAVARRKLWWIIWALYAVFGYYYMLDAYQTKLLFDMGAQEANPLLNWLMSVMGTWWAIVYFKVTWLIIFAVTLCAEQRQLEKRIS